MNTPAHLIFGAAAFGRPGRPAVTVAALAGGLAPDLSLYLMASWALFVQQMPPGIVFGQLYHSDAWQAVFAVDNSIVLWSGLLAIGFALRRAWLMAFTAAAILHLVFDFALHHDDARPEFWPITDWVFVSPLSYWDPAHHGTLVGRLEAGISAVLCVVLWVRFRALWMRLTTLALALAELLPDLLWRLVF